MYSLERRAKVGAQLLFQNCGKKSARKAICTCLILYTRKWRKAIKTSVNHWEDGRWSTTAAAFSYNEQIIRKPRLIVSKLSPICPDNSLNNGNYSLNNRNYSLNNRDYSLTNRNYSLSNRDYSLSNRDYSLNNRNYSLNNRDNSLNNRDYSSNNQDCSLNNRDYSLNERNWSPNNARYSKLL